MLGSRTELRAAFGSVGGEPPLLLLPRAQGGKSRICCEEDKIRR